MCNIYVPPSHERLGKPNLKRVWGAYVAPLKPGPYFKQGDALEVGQWGMIAPDAKSRVPQGATNNARRETLSTRSTYRGPYAKGQRCLIPAETFEEPFYPEHDPNAKSIAWRFARADGEPWMLAGLWAEWVSAEGEIVPSYTMITQNCDGHPLLALMHKPEIDRSTKAVLPADRQDKRAVVPIERDRWDEWLHGSIDQAESLIRLPSLEIFQHWARDAAKNIPLPGVARNTQIFTSGEGLF